METDPEIVKLPDAMLATMERRCSELQAFNAAIDKVLDGLFKEFLAKPNFKDLPFYKSEIEEKLLNTETAFFRAFNVIFALILNRSGFAPQHVAFFSRMVDQKQLGTAEQPWNDKRFMYPLNTDQTITPAVRYILRIQAALLRNTRTANELSIAELSRIVQDFKMPAMTAKAAFAPYRDIYSTAIKSVVEKVYVPPEAADQVREILTQAKYTNIKLDADNQTWTADLNGKHSSSGSWKDVIDGLDPIAHRLFIEARRKISARQRSKSAAEDD